VSGNAVPILLAALAIVDAGFAGFRAAAGRDGRIFKRSYYARAVVRGAAAGVALVAALGLLTWLLLSALPSESALWSELLAIGARMLDVFGVYVALVVFALAVYVVPRSEVRILATVAILGPFTLLRPAVVAAAVVWGLLALGPARSAVAIALTIGSSAAVLALGWLFDRIEHARALPRLGGAARG
jgi:hypothetical protein